MGYSTDFKGEFTLSRTATGEEINYINTLSDTRRMKRDVNKLQEIHQGKYGFNGIYGIEGEYFIGYSQIGIIDHNTPPGQISYDDTLYEWRENKKRIKKGECQPGLWCQWIITEDGTKLKWDDGEKFYYYVEWLKYLIKHFFSIWNIKLNGEIFYDGEKENDNGNIIIINNEVYKNTTLKDIRKKKLKSIEETIL